MEKRIAVAIMLIACVRLALGDTHYVDINNASPSVPYTTWETAANDIQIAIHTAEDGDTVLVAGGIYRTGGEVAHSMSNRVVLTKAVTVMNASDGLIRVWIEGEGPHGPEAMRCAYVDHAGATLSGFIFLDGHTRTSGHWINDRSGGGAYLQGGGTLVHCTIAENSADISGGGVFVDGTLPIIHNSIVWDNSGGDKWSGSGSWTNNCTVPLAGSGCISNDPQFAAAGDFHLSGGSPCIDFCDPLAGVIDDFDGTPRPLDGNASGSAFYDIGAYEYAHPTLDSDGDQLGDGFEVHTFGSNPLKKNTDGDPHSDLQEYIAGTIPSNADSYFRITRIEPTATGIVVEWAPSVYDRFYTILWTNGLFESSSTQPLTGGSLCRPSTGKRPYRDGFSG